MIVAAKLVIAGSAMPSGIRAILKAHILFRPHRSQYLCTWTQEKWDSLSTEEIIELDEFIDGLDRTEYGFVTLTKDDRHGEVAGYLASQLVDVSWRG